MVETHALLIWGDLPLIFRTKFPVDNFKYGVSTANISWPVISIRIFFNYQTANIWMPNLLDEFFSPKLYNLWQNESKLNPKKNNPICYYLCPVPSITLCILSFPDIKIFLINLFGSLYFQRFCITMRIHLSFYFRALKWNEIIVCLLPTSDFTNSLLSVSTNRQI